MSWIEHVKDYRAKHPGMTYGEAMSAAKSTWKGSKKSKVGAGIMDSIKESVMDALIPQRKPMRNMQNMINRITGGSKTKRKVGKGIIDSIKNTLFFPPNKLPGNAQKAYDRFKGATVKGIMINRTPINGMVDKFINLVSLGGFNKAKKQLGYDSMFHLSMVLTTNQGKIGVEKNERINIQAGGTGGGQSIDIQYDTGDTFGSFLEKARRKMGDHRFFQYNAFANNCQDFILGLLSANGVLSPEAREFIKQDAEALIKRMPSYVGRIAQAATDLGGKVSQILTGQGRKRKKKIVKK